MDKKQVVRGLKFLVILALAGCTSQPAKESPQAQATKGSREAKPTVLYQSNRLGSLEPCGCDSKPFGGMDREWNAAQMIRGEGQPVVFVDAGNALAPSNKKGPLKHHQEKAKTIVGLMNELGVDAFAPGPADYGLGLEALAGLKAASRFLWVSTNVLKGGTPVFSPYVVVERNGLRIGVLSASPFGAIKEAGVTPVEPKTAIEQLLPEVTAKSDVVVLLSQLATASDSDLAPKLAGVHVVVGSDTKSAFEEPLWFTARNIEVDPHINGYYLGRLNLDLRLPFEGLFSPAAVTKNRNELAEWKAQLVKDPSNTFAKRSVEFLEKTACLAPIEGGSNYTNELIPLDPKRFGKKNALTALLTQEKERVRQRAIREASE